METIKLNTLVCLFCLLGAVIGQGAYDWMTYDAFDEINDRMDAITPENCRAKPVAELMLNPDSVAQKPVSNKLLSQLIYPNRTCLLHLHNMALNRAYFYSYMNQALNETKTEFHMQPGLMYYYMSAEADVAANPGCINGSAIMWDNHYTYANWYTNLEFNHTLPLFGARAWRFDDYNEPTNWLREPTNYTINIEDYGAGQGSNYSNSDYKLNEWYNMWMPDADSSLDSLRKHTYDVAVHFSNQTGEFINKEGYEGRAFFGPSSPGQREIEHLPVKYTAPYYDCGRSNKWIISATSPVLDYVPRYIFNWTDLSRQRFVGAIVMDTDFLKIDLNPCPAGQGNPPPNMFQNIARCDPTTQCEPHHGWGFKRGGYNCACRPGYRYPAFQNGPYEGVDIERATNTEHERGFQCLETGWKQTLPNLDGERPVDTGVIPGLGRKKRAINSRKHVESDLVKSRKKRTMLKSRTKRKTPVSLKETFIEAMNVVIKPEIEVKERARRHIVSKRALPKPEEKITKEAPKVKRSFVPRYERDTSKHRVKRDFFDAEAFERFQRIDNHRLQVKADNCHLMTKDDLFLPGDVAYGADEQLQNQARTALRMAHFISNFMENIDFYEEYGTLRGDRPLNYEQLFGEVMANVMADYKIHGSGIFFDTDKFVNLDGTTRQYFGPYAYKASGTRTKVVDFAGFDGEPYINDDWFVNIKERWQSNVYGLKKWTTKALVRSDLKGTALNRFEHYPMFYRAPALDDGQWSKPYFDCGGHTGINDWVITYSVPFFGMNSLRTHIEFKGVATVDVLLAELDIHQCPMPFHVPNAFKSTARCHYESTRCVHLPGKKFNKGSYKCECRQGYEYPFNDRAWYYDGQTMESEYNKMIAAEKGESNPDEVRHRFHTLKCRPASAPRIAGSSILLLVIAAVIHMMH
ncbi:unnamed protein product [Owenia fusiformis]|uniref:GPR158/179 extracellular domain-containing protein n=1 Tax=Owenia fusiformis TaxID=6347 RepID=A0A8S4Q7T4_OWEFU|nr:unnamed protein product [Owenia fusiformis]